MKDHVYKLVEIVGTSTIGLEDAINKGLTRAGKTLKNLRWFEVGQIRGEIDGQKVAHWQVTLKIGFTVEEGGR
jgi:flavin-binding protein dodecin